MQTSDRLRMFRSLGLSIAGILLVGGAVFGSQAISGQHRDDTLNPSADVSRDDQFDEGSASEDASESPEASELEDVNEDVNDDDATPAEATASEDEATGPEDASGTADPSESPDDHGGNSGPGGDGSNDD